MCLWLASELLLDFGMALLEPELFELLRGFYSLLLPHDMHFPVHLLPSTLHAFFVDVILSNSRFQQYPPSTQYQKTFWKWVIHYLEHITPAEACTFACACDGLDKPCGIGFRDRSTYLRALSVTSASLWTVCMQTSAMHVFLNYLQSSWDSSTRCP